MNSRLIWIGVADKVILHDGNLTDLSALIRILTEVEPQKSTTLRHSRSSDHPGSSRC